MASEEFESLEGKVVEAEGFKVAVPSGPPSSSEARAWVLLSNNKNAAITGRYFSMSYCPQKYMLPF
jgi:hypothetical protein